MGQIIKLPYTEPVNEGEQRLLNFLRDKLPREYYIIPNATYSSWDGKCRIRYEYDCIVVAPHGVYHIENKDWSGELRGTEREWYQNGVKKENPLISCERKSKVLASLLKNNKDSRFRKVRVDSVVTLSHPNQNLNGFKSREDYSYRVYLLDKALVKHLTDPSGIGKTANCIVDVRQGILSFLQKESRHDPCQDSKTILDYTIIKRVKETPGTEYTYREYIGEKSGVVTTKKLIKEWRLKFSDMTESRKDEIRKRILNQKHALEKLSVAPNIFRTEYPYNDKEDANQFFEVCDYCPECSLREILYGKNELTVVQKREIVLQLCEALKAVHESTVIHRDVRPENVYYIKGRALLGGFGKAFFPEHDTAGYTVMEPGSKTGPYDAPELLNGNEDNRCDIYSLGVLIYEMFTKKMPVKDHFELNNLQGRLPDERLPSRVNNLLPDWLDKVVEKCICYRAEDRWQDVGEIAGYICECETVSQEQTTGPDAPQELVNTVPEEGMYMTQTVNASANFQTD